MLASDSACETGEFGPSAIQRLAGTIELTSLLIRQLQEHKILYPSANTPTGSFQIQSDGVFSFHSHLMVWRFTQDAEGLNFPQVFTRLRAALLTCMRDVNNVLLIEKLWWLLAQDDLRAFMDEELAQYTLPRGRIGLKTEEAFRSALDRLPLPQARNQLRFVIGNAARYSAMRGVDRLRARNTIPRNFIERVDYVIASHGKRYEHFRDWQEKESVLFRVLFDSILQTGLNGFRTINGENLRRTLVDMLPA